MHSSPDCVANTKVSDRGHEHKVSYCFVYRSGSYRWWVESRRVWGSSGWYIYPGYPVLDLVPPSEQGHWVKLHAWDLCVCFLRMFRKAVSPFSSSSEVLQYGQKAGPTLYRLIKQLPLWSVLSQGLSCRVWLWTPLLCFCFTPGRTQQLGPWNRGILAALRPVEYCQGNSAYPNNKVYYTFSRKEVSRSYLCSKHLAHSGSEIF